MLSPRICAILAGLATVACSGAGTAASPTGSAAPVDSPSSGVLASIPDVRLVPAFPAAGARPFGARPLFFTEVPDGSGRAVVVEQSGVVYVLPLDADAGAAPAVFLDISDRVSTAGNEEGLLGLAFAPGFERNGEVYAYYSAAGPRRSVLSRFRAVPSGLAVDPGSEEVVLEVPEPYANHNGGMLAFGPDGYLYVGLGDGGSGGDPQGNGQDAGTLLGAILRIDVSGDESGRTYRVPGDNPFVGDGGGARPEVWAFGLRNPWRFSFDRQTGRLWAGDVGQNSWEEIDIIERGANYGWNIMEGTHCFEAATCDGNSLTLPVIEYATGKIGCAVTGGYVYRGAAQPSLRGVYVYADYCSGAIFGLRLLDGRPVGGPTLIADSGMAISSFGEDSAGELYVTGFGGDEGGPGVYRVVAR